MRIVFAFICLFLASGCEKEKPPVHRMTNEEFKEFLGVRSGSSSNQNRSAPSGNAAWNQTINQIPVAPDSPQMQIPPTIPRPMAPTPQFNSGNNYDIYARECRSSCYMYTKGPERYECLRECSR